MNPGGEQGFLRTILEDPEDDASRLVYADWLEEQGQERRAEFIRLQCRLAGMGEFDPARAELLEREWELLAVYRRSWQPDWPDWVLRVPLRFRRGFVGGIDVTADQFLRIADQLFALAPIEEMRLYRGAGVLGEVAKSPFLEQLTGIDFSPDELPGADLAAFLSSPHLSRLRRLSVGHYNAPLTDEAVAALASWPGLCRITHLELHHLRAYPNNPPVGYNACISLRRRRERWKPRRGRMNGASLTSFGRR